MFSASVRLVLSALVLFSAVVSAQAAGPFTDAKLEQVVRGVLFDKQDPSKPLTDDDLRKVFILPGRNAGITNLAGLEKCTNLLQLDLAGNAIADVKPLEGLVHLQSLDLSKNKIASLAPLAKLTALQYLELSDNQVSDVTVLAGLTKLSALYLAGNKIADVGPLGKLAKLSSLDLAKNQVANVAPLAEVKGLMLLKLSDNPLSDLSPVAKAPPSSLLIVERTKIADLQGLVEAATADAAGPKRFAPFLRLYLAGNPLGEKAKGEQLSALRKAGVRIEDLDPPAAKSAK